MRDTPFLVFVVYQEIDCIDISYINTRSRVALLLFLYRRLIFMDKIDKKIISLLQENARYPLKYLAQKVFLSSPPSPPALNGWKKAASSPDIMQRWTRWP